MECAGTLFVCEVKPEKGAAGGYNSTRTKSIVKEMRAQVSRWLVLVCLIVCGHGGIVSDRILSLILVVQNSSHSC